MKVWELRVALSIFDDDDLVVMSDDAEGNGFSPLADLDEASYKANTTYSGEIGLRKLTPELIAQGYSEEDVLDGVNAVVLYPIY